MILTPGERRKIEHILSSVDGGCSVCASNAIDHWNRLFPENRLVYREKQVPIRFRGKPGKGFGKPITLQAATDILKKAYPAAKEPK